MGPRAQAGAKATPPHSRLCPEVPMEQEGPWHPLSTTPPSPASGTPPSLARLVPRRSLQLRDWGWVTTLSSPHPPTSQPCMEEEEATL